MNIGTYVSFERFPKCNRNHLQRSSHILSLFSGHIDPFETGILKHRSIEVKKISSKENSKCILLFVLDLICIRGRRCKQSQMFKKGLKESLQFTLQCTTPKIICFKDYIERKIITFII